MVIDYSKWDNIDTDSDDEPAGPVPAPMPQTAQKTPAQPTQTPSPATDTPANASSTTDQIKAVIVRCNGDTTGPKWSATTIAGADPIFDQQPGSEAPLPAVLGIPLIFRRFPSAQFGTTRPDGLDNQIATYLNIELASGFAPAAWQSGVGTVLVARLDKKPLLEQHLEGLWMYCDRVLDIFGDGCGAPRHLYNRPAFEKWWARYAEEARGYRGDWKNVPTPYQV